MLIYFLQMALFSKCMCFNYELFKKKIMQKPLKTPPIAQVEAEETKASVPSLEVETKNNLSATSGTESVPTINPPSAYNETADGGFGAGAWNENKKVSALFTVNETRNSWMSVVGTGWVKLASNIDSANEALTILATSAKVKSSPINYFLDNDQVTQIYVW